MVALGTHHTHILLLTLALILLLATSTRTRARKTWLFADTSDGQQAE